MSTFDDLRARALEIRRQADMNWNDLAGKVIGLGAPVLGGALGGPLGAAAGKILADALGAHGSGARDEQEEVMSRSSDIHPLVSKTA
jgi:outer membrane lipoprotein SlyB